MAIEQNSSIIDQATDSGIMKGLQELIDLEIELKPTTMMELEGEFSKECQLHFQKQYVEYSLKVKELLQKLLRKLEDNYEYQRYLEDEIKLLETGVPNSSIDDQPTITRIFFHDSQCSRFYINQSSRCFSRFAQRRYEVRIGAKRSKNVPEFSISN